MRPRQALHSRRAHRALALASAVALAHPALAQTPPGAARADGPAAASPGQQVDALFARWHTPQTPAAAVLVMRDGRIVHAKGYGMASLEQGVPIRTRTVFDIASVSKQFGAMAILLLVADGRLALDDEVRRYVPELPDFGHPITVRHLVHHTSGLRDWPGTLRIAGWSFDDVISFDQILRMTYNQRDLNFPPGSAYAYSNTGYNVLAEVVQRVSGKSFREFTDERIFRPLGMHDTHFHDDHAMIVPQLADSYRRLPDGSHRRVTNNLTALASSSLFTTVEDLARWVENYETGVVGGRTTVAQSHERGVLTNGDTIPYAFGQSHGSYRGLRTMSHTGSWAGYRTVLTRFPDARAAVIILSNTAEMNPAALANQVADIWLHDLLAPRAAATAGAAGAGAPAAPTWRPTATELRAFVGDYHSAELQTGYTLRLRESGQLVAWHFRIGEVVLNPTTRDRFQSGLFGELRVERDPAGRVTGFTANSDRVRGLRFVRVR